MGFVENLSKLFWHATPGRSGTAGTCTTNPNSTRSRFWIKLYRHNASATASGAAAARAAGVAAAAAARIANTAAAVPAAPATTGAFAAGTAGVTEPDSPALVCAGGCAPTLIRKREREP